LLSSQIVIWVRLQNGWLDTHDRSPSLTSCPQAEASSFILYTL